MVEWNENQGSIERNYLGLDRCSSGVVEFDISINRYLAAGDAHVIKVWNVNDPQLLTVVDAGGDLPVCTLLAIIILSESYKMRFFLCFVSVFYVNAEVDTNITHCLKTKTRKCR